MKRVIEGVRYDTENAINIGGVTPNPDRSDFRFYDADLYRTPKSGRYFLAGEGGPLTVFATRDDSGMRGPGKKILPMTREEAFDWAQNHLNTKTIEAEFSDMIEDA